MSNRSSVDRLCLLFLLAIANAAIHAQEVDPNSAAAESPPAEMQYPLSAVVADDGTVYIADRKLPGIWRWKEGERTPYFTASKQFRTQLNAVRCVALDAEGRLLAGDSATREVYRFDENGQPHGLTAGPAAEGADGDAEKGPRFGRIGIPMDLAVDAKGAIYVSDLESHRIWRIPAEGGTPEEFAVVAAPRGLDLDAEGHLWVVTHGKDQVLRFDPQGKPTVVVGGRPFRLPHEIEAVSATEAVLTDGYGKAVWKVARDAEPTKLHEGPPLDNPVGITAVGDNYLVVDTRANGLFELSPAGKLTAFPAK
jgi:DNA-binding beta-propeller fold protein YncE